jgi:hypothetical protein
LRARYAASTPHQRVLSRVPFRARLPAISPLADAVRRFTQPYTTSHNFTQLHNPETLDAGTDKQQISHLARTPLHGRLCVGFWPFKAKPDQLQPA